jgi:hypothetical protein
MPQRLNILGCCTRASQPYFCSKPFLPLWIVCGGTARRTHLRSLQLVYARIEHPKISVASRNQAEREPCPKTGTQSMSSPGPPIASHSSPPPIPPAQPPPPPLALPPPPPSDGRSIQAATSPADGEEEQGKGRCRRFMSCPCQWSKCTNKMQLVWAQYFVLHLAYYSLLLSDVILYFTLSSMYIQPTMVYQVLLIPCGLLFFSH